MSSAISPLLPIICVIINWVTVGIHVLTTYNVLVTGTAIPLKRRFYLGFRRAWGQKDLGLTICVRRVNCGCLAGIVRIQEGCHGCMDRW